MRPLIATLGFGHGSMVANIVVGGSCITAEAALRAYVVVVARNGFDLACFPRVCDGLGRMWSQSGLVPMTSISD